VRSYQPLLGQHALLDVNACEIEQRVLVVRCILCFCLQNKHQYI
jgi:hypothetical protein